MSYYLLYLLEQVLNTVPSASTIHYTSPVQVGPQKRETVQALLDAGVSLTTFSDTGAHLFTACAANADADAEFITYLLGLPGVAHLLNEPMRPKSRKWKFLYAVSRLLVKLGSKKATLRAVSSWHGQTPLGSAARNNHHTAITLLSKAGADRTMRNKQGHTPAQQYRLISGEQCFHPDLAPHMSL